MPVIDLVFTLLHLGVHAIMGNVQLFNVQDVPLPRLGEVAPVVFRAEPMGLNTMFETDADRAAQCRFTGLIVPYDRTWEETRTAENHVIVDAPEPGKIAAYALVINKKTCPGKAPEPVLLFAQRPGFKTLFNSDVMLHSHSYMFQPAQALSEQNKPKWIPQVDERIRLAAVENPSAREFIGDIESFAAGRTAVAQ